MCTRRGVHYTHTHTVTSIKVRLNQREKRQTRNYYGKQKLVVVCSKGKSKAIR